MVKKTLMTNKPMLTPLTYFSLPTTNKTVNKDAMGLLTLSKPLLPLQVLVIQIEFRQSTVKNESADMCTSSKQTFPPTVYSTMSNGVQIMINQEEWEGGQKRICQATTSTIRFGYPVRRIPMTGILSVTSQDCVCRHAHQYQASEYFIYKFWLLSNRVQMAATRGE